MPNSKSTTPTTVGFSALAIFDTFERSGVGEQGQRVQAQRR